uniref:Predicted gene 3542 n=1 Tax=Mus musculus TaxID=10090 RepID=K7N6U2_MOUSE
MFSRLLRLCQKENGDEGETRPKKKEEGILSHEKGRRKSFWRRHRSARNTSTQNSNITNQISNINKVEELKLHIRKTSNERKEMCGILNVYMYEDLNYRMNTEFNIIKSQHEKTMLDMNKMIQSIIGSMQYSKELIEDNYSYSIKEDHLLRECTQLNEKVRILLNENRKLLVEQAGTQVSCEEERGSLRRPARTSVPQVQRNSSFPKCETVQQKLEHGTDHDMISLKEKCWWKRTGCAQEIHHCCLSSLITMAVMGCMLLLYFGFLGMNRP